MLDGQLVERFNYLSWRLLAHKLMYYYPEKVHPSWQKELDISDADYDALEQEYLRLCIKLGKPNTVAGQSTVDGETVSGDGMTQLDLSRPSVSLVLFKHSKRRVQ